MKNEAEFVSHCLELMESLSSDITSKRMFGGSGIFREGLMFALVADAQLYFKVDEINDSTFADLDLPKFTYLRGEKEMHLSYRICPESAFEGTTAMRQWAKLGWEAAVRADEAKPIAKQKRQKHLR